MDRTALIKKCSGNDICCEKEYGIKIDCFPWDHSYIPETNASICYTDNSLKLCFISKETPIKANYRKLNDMVYEDSCVEFFFNPNPTQDERYFNFEFNALGTLYLSLGIQRYDRTVIDDVNVDIFQIKTAVTPETIDDYKEKPWFVEYIIPYSFIEKYFGKLPFGQGWKMAGNFYKCGECTIHPHYGCWNMVVSEKPDFHRPECFGELLFE